MMVLEPPTIRSLPIHVCNAMMDRGCMPREDKFAGLHSGLNCHITANIDRLVCDPDLTTACNLGAAIRFSPRSRQWDGKKRKGRKNDADVRISDIGTGMNLAVAGNYRGRNLSRCSLLMSIERRSFGRFCANEI
ncbi:MAG: hypothetical protein RLO48_16585 [Bauldia litoralis]